MDLFVRLADALDKIRKLGFSEIADFLEKEAAIDYEPIGKIEGLKMVWAPKISAAMNGYADGLGLAYKNNYSELLKEDPIKKWLDDPSKPERKALWNGTSFGVRQSATGKAVQMGYQAASGWKLIEGKVFASKEEAKKDMAEIEKDMKEKFQKDFRAAVNTTRAELQKLKKPAGKPVEKPEKPA